MSLFRRFSEFFWAGVYKHLADMDLWLIKKSYLGHIDGVAISDTSLSRRSPNEFLEKTSEAMALIKQHDPRRYRRVCRQFRFIVNRDLVEAGNFQQNGKVCNIDSSKFLLVPQVEWRVRSYACVLVHEATHGVIAERGITYDKENRLRIERVCHLEGYRFADCFEPGFADTFVGPFNPEQWKMAWGPPEDQRAASRERFRESLKEMFSSWRK